MNKWKFGWILTLIVSAAMGFQHAPSWAISLLWGGYFLWMVNAISEDDNDDSE